MIDRHQIRQIILRFRRICLARYPEDIDTILPEEHKNRLELYLYDDFDNLIFVAAESMHGPIEDICRLVVSTPRLLKIILRRSLLGWEQLHGEIDFDDLLIANVLRFSAPQAFDFLLNLIPEIRVLNTAGAQDTKIRKEREKTLEEKWNNLIKDCIWDYTSVKRLLCILFPYWVSERHLRKISVSQGIEVASPTDYWRRYLSEEIAPNEIRDQEVLYTLKQWKANPTNSRFRDLSIQTALCESNDFTDKVEQFALFVLNGDDIRQLAASLFEKALELQGVSTNSDNIPGFLSLWRKAIRSPIDEQEHLKWVYEQIENALPKSLRFANEIYYYWSRNSEFDIHDEQNRVQLRMKVIEKAKTIFNNEPDKFVKVLDPKNINSSYHFCVDFSNANKGGGGFVPEQWEWFANLLLEAGKSSTEIIIPQIAVFILNEKMDFSESTYQFNEELTKKLFGHKMDQLMELMKTDINLDAFNDREKNLITNAKRIANQWLSEQVKDH